MAEAASPSASQDLRSALGSLASGLWGGLISGALIGGVGGRLAMFLLRVTSDPSVVGMESDDGFVIGRFSSDTGFLVLATAALGALGGLFYLLIRGWLPDAGRAGLFGGLGAALGGALVVHPDGIDFALLEPRWLAIALFVALPGTYGVAAAWLTERFLARTSRPTPEHWIVAVLPLVGMALLGPVGLAILVLAAGGWLLNRKVPLSRWWNSAAVVWLGRAVLAVGFAWAVTALVGDVAAIL